MHDSKLPHTPVLTVADLPGHSHDVFGSAGNWRSMDSAPRDGSLFLMLRDHPVIPTVYTAWWDRHYWVLNEAGALFPYEAAGDGYCYWMPWPGSPNHSV